MKAVSNESTRIYNSFSNGWTGETKTAESGEGWKITTAKGNNGKLRSYATRVTFLPNGSFTWDMFGAKNVNLLTTTSRATEKTVREQHAKALLLFDEHPEVKAEVIEAEQAGEIEIGTIIFTDGYSHYKGSENNNHIVYKIESTQWGVNYLTVERDSLILDTKSHVRHYSKKFGIGSYYDTLKFAGTQDELNNLVIAAQEKKQAERQAEESRKLLQQMATAGKIEEGKELVNIPQNAVCVIVAELYQDDSDSMTDYFSTSKSKTVYLAFSATKTNNMKELRKAAATFEETKDFATAGEDMEHTKGHSYLPDYFLGSNRWSGWKVSKNKYFDLQKNADALYIAASEGRYLIPSADATTTPIEAVKIEGLELIQYSDKAVALFGDSRAIKDQLKAIGGRFNPRLKYGDTTAAGWIFQSSKAEEIKKLIG